MMYKVDLSNKRFGKLTVIEYAGHNKHKHILWKCKCDCGNIVEVDTGALNSGHTKSCGCSHADHMKKIRTTHGESKTRLYKIWLDIKARCYNQKNKFFNIYGGKGICICDEWKNSYEAFSEWAYKNGYTDELTIDRINVNGNYEPDNCRWANQYIQASNRSNTHYVEYHGQKDSLDNLCRNLNVNSKTIRQRMRRNNLSFEQAVDNYSYTSEFKEYWKK